MQVLKRRSHSFAARSQGNLFLHYRRGFHTSSSFVDLWLCERGYEQIAALDLSANLHVEAALLSPGVLISPDKPDIDYQQSSWSRQVLPRCVTVTGNSISNLSSQALLHLIPLVQHKLSTIPTSLSQNNPRLKFFHIHAFSPPDSNLSGRCGLIRDAAAQTLKGTNRRVFRHMQFHEYTSTPTHPSPEYPQDLIQLFLLATNRLLISTYPLCYSPVVGWKLPLPWIEGRFIVAEDNTPPSRAYKKLDEIFAHLGFKPSPGEVIVELGSSPGGWTSRLAAIHPDIRVISIDRAPLDESLVARFRPPRLTHIIADGSTWIPPQCEASTSPPHLVSGPALASNKTSPVDWVFSDMALPSHKSASVLCKWIAQNWCRRFVWTLKFVGQHEYGVIEEVKTMLNDKGCTYVAKHLVNHGNEVVIIGQINR